MRCALGSPKCITGTLFPDGKLSDHSCLHCETIHFHLSDEERQLYDELLDAERKLYAKIRQKEEPPARQYDRYMLRLKKLYDKRRQKYEVSTLRRGDLPG